MLPGPVAAMADPSKLAKGDYWTWTCGLCSLCTQGGMGGLNAHMATVHPGEQPKPPSSKRTS